jgi:hypothetical protein
MEKSTMFKEAIHVPRLKPAAQDTWELQGSLLGAVEESETISMPFPGPVRIVGMYPSLSGVPPTGGLVQPNLDDVMILLDFNQKRRYTAQIGQTSQAQRGQGFVTLNSLNTTIRDLEIEVDNERPVMDVQFRWKRFTQGTPLFPDQTVSLSFFVEVL